MIAYYIIVLIVGLVIGSFLNVCIYRIPAEESIIRPPSHCPSCNHLLGVKDLIPVLSYILLKGRCRYCGANVSIQYPIVELITGLLFMLVAVVLGLSWAALAGFILTAILITVTMIDLELQIIPNEIVLFGAIVGIPLMAVQGWSILKDGLIAGLGAGLFLLLVGLIGSWIAGKEAMGGGDIKLVAMMGIYLGIKGTVIGLFLGILAGGIIGALLIVLAKKGGKEPIPFGPFLAFGGYLAMLWAQDIINWYLGLFNMG